MDKEILDETTITPPETIDALKEEAAKSSGRDPAEITIKEALDILFWDNSVPAVRDFINAAAEGKIESILFDYDPENEAEAAAAKELKEHILKASKENRKTAKERIYEKIAGGRLGDGIGVIAEIKENGLTRALLEQWRELEKAGSWDFFINDIVFAIKVNDLQKELAELNEYLERETEKPEYKGKDIDALLISYVNDDNEENKLLFIRALTAAREAADIVLSQKEGRKERQRLRDNATSKGAIMEIRGGNYPIFSRKSLRDAFAPGRLCKLGTLDTCYIDENGYINKRNFESGEILPLNASEIQSNPFLLLSAILANSVDNVREEFVQGGTITFYVKGVLSEMEIDPRSYIHKEDQKERPDRKTAAVLYLENLFRPLQEYIGMTENGSRYSVFNYIGYDADADTMTIQTPYIYQLWTATQQDYFERQDRLKRAYNAGKKPNKDDLTPLEINNLFKKRAYTEDEITRDIAIYLTNVMLAAGGKPGQIKTTKLSFRTIINGCERLKTRLLEIEEQPAKSAKKGKKTNKTATYNAVLKKFKGAVRLILDPERCDALKYYDFLEISPAKGIRDEKGNIISWEFIPPTKSTIKNQIIIKWRRKPENKTV